MKENQLKMSYKRFLSITVPLVTILLIVIVSTTIIMNFWGATMDMVLGKGMLHIIPMEGTETWDTGYYYKKNIVETKKNSVTAAKNISDEGIVLLKNNGTLPLSKTNKITPFGRSVVDPIYGGSGSGHVNTSQEYVVTCEEFLIDTFGNNLNISMITKLKEILDKDGGRKGKYARGQVTDSFNIGEFPVSEFAAIEATFQEYNDIGIVFVGRVGGEGADLTHDMSDYGGSKGQHQLEFDSIEKEVIEKAKKVCEKVIVVLNMSTTIELGFLEEDPEIDAILWIGSPGAVGFKSLGEIIIGDINPSGRTVDTFAADFTKDPTWVNSGDYEFTNAQTQYIIGMDTGNAKYLEYEEGIYLGYRYYETASNEFGNDWYTEWKNAKDKSSGNGVVYPFGYGLSYTTFNQKIKQKSHSGDKITLTVDVENIGEYPGKDVIQIYYTAPYFNNRLEKSYVNLVAFAKTKVLEKGDKDEVTVDFLKEDMASYDHVNEKAYVLDSGEYEIKLMNNSHDKWESFKLTVDKKIVYNSENPRQTEKDAQSYLDSDGSLGNVQTPARGLTEPNAKFISAINRFDDLNQYMSEPTVTNLSRGGFSATFPTQAQNREAPEYVVEDLAIRSFDYKTDEKLGNIPESKIYKNEKPVMNENNGLKLIDLRGLNYYDERWDLLLNQLSYADEELLVTVGANYQTREIIGLGKPSTLDKDGPQGLKGIYKVDDKIEPACAWCSEPVLASTFNKKLAFEMGLAIGQEALIMGVTGWYAPGLNIHRTPFSGRNFEYYSEDPYLSGKMAAAVVSGAGDCGLNVYLKHFALNDQETNRLQLVGIYATEQAIREIYLKAFEICIKEAKCTVKYIMDEKGNQGTTIKRAATAIMTAHNSIGTVHVTESYALLTEVLRDEWGFTGMINTDMGGGIDYDKRLRAGNDMSMDGRSILSVKDKSSATALHAYRKAIKNILYATVNSNAMNGIAPGTYFYYDWSPWAIWLLIGNILVYLLILLLICLAVYKITDENKNPEKYSKNQVV